MVTTGGRIRNGMMARFEDERLENITAIVHQGLWLPCELHLKTLIEQPVNPASIPTR